MAAPVPADAKAERLLSVLRPYLLQLLRDAPDFGEISIAASLHDGQVGRVRLGAEVSRIIGGRA